MSKLLPIINVALTGIVLVIMIIVLVQVGSVRSILIPETQKNESGEVVIPLSQLEEVNLGAEDDQFILKLTNEDTGKTANVVLKVGVAIDTKHKGAEESRQILTSQGRIIRDRIYSILISKDLSYYKEYSKQEELKKELVLKFQELIGNEAVVDVYFNNLIVSE
jgi:flagellar basal body-associated protein FliL